MHIKKIAIIGGGASGLCAARHLLHSSFNTKLEPVIFEQKPHIGGTWVYEDWNEEKPQKEVFSSLYKNLKSNLPKEIMAFPDFPFPDHLPTFTHHTEVIQYLNDYTEKFDLKKVINFSKKVTSVSPIIPQVGPLDDLSRFVKWNVEVESLDSNYSETNTFDAVAVCNGHYSVPSYPEIDGKEHFKGKILHSHYYREPSNFAGKSVLVLGSGASGYDIMRELSSVCSQVLFSHTKDRSGELPENVKELPGISYINGNGEFVFEGGYKSSVDIFLPCTGYLYDFPFLDQSCEVKIEENGRIVTPLFKHLFHTKYPSLIFLGIPWRSIPFPLAHSQSQYFANVLSRKVSLPSEHLMNLDRNNEKIELIERGDPIRHLHLLGLNQWSYMEDLAERCENQ